MKSLVPPHDVGAERAVLAAMLIENAVIPDVLDLLRPADFYVDAHGRSFDAMAALHNRGQAVDTVTLRAELEAKNRLAQVGGDDFLLSLTNVIPTTAHVETHAKLVQERARLRRFIDEARRQIEHAYEQVSDSEMFLGEAESAILRATDTSGNHTTCRNIGELAGAVYNRAKSASERGERVRGLGTGIPAVDALTNGLYDGELIVIGGRPAMGKSALAGGIAMHVAEEARRGAVVFSLEMRGETWATRAIAATSPIEATRVRSGDIRSNEWGVFLKATTAFEDLPLFIDDGGAVTLQRIRSRALRIRREHGLALIVVDYLQLMGSTSRHANREAVVAENSRGLKMLAMELEVPVIALSQLNRALEQRPNKRPLMSDLRESGAIEQDADKIIFVYRDEVYDPNKNKGVAEIIVGKARSGSTGTVEVAFHARHTRFAELERATPRAPEQGHWTDRDYQDA